jgi:molybdopterin converting factor small subunit
MQVVVQLFSFLRDCLPPGTERGRVTVEMTTGSTAKDLFAQLELNRCLPGGRRIEDELTSWQVSVNGEFISDLNRVLHGGDHVMVFPHMAGG